MEVNTTPSVQVMIKGRKKERKKGVNLLELAQVKDRTPCKETI